MWPNLARTPTLPPGGLEGELVDGGDGRGLEGQPVAGRIVLLDYDSGRAWVDAFHLGAAAVVFLESPEAAHRKEAELKFLDVPADLPRLYARAPEVNRLRRLAREGVRVRLSGRMVWRRAEGRNLVAVIEGRDPDLRREAILLTAYYDAVSPVPALTPGAEQASGAAALLELARGLAAQPPARTVVLLWTAGHFQNLAGMRHFTPLLLQAARTPRRPGGGLAPVAAALRSGPALPGRPRPVGAQLAAGCLQAAGPLPHLAAGSPRSRPGSWSWPPPTRTRPRGAPCSWPTVSSRTWPARVSAAWP